MKLFLILCISWSLFSEKIGFLVTGTGRYLPYAERVVESAIQYLLPSHEVTCFIFTDGTLKETLQNNPRVRCMAQQRLGWPFDSMNRYHIYLKHREILSEYDYLFACDADNLIIDVVGDEILGERVAIMHAGFLTSRGPYETNPLSAAYVDPQEGERYFTGAFYGGTANEMIHIFEELSEQVNRDSALGIIARWWDESHWNRYCINHEPTLILPPSYWCTENADLPYPKKILAIIKDHDALRAP